MQVAQLQILLLGDHRSIEGLSELLGRDAGTALNLHLSESGLGLAEGAAALSFERVRPFKTGSLAPA